MRYDSSMAKNAHVTEYTVIDDYDGDLCGGTEAREYADGNIRNERGHMLAPLAGCTMITSETARAIGQIARDNKRRAIIDGANAIVDQGLAPSGAKLLGEERFIQAIAEAQTIKALNSDDAKSTDAAKFLMLESGVGEAAARGVDALVDDDNAEIRHMLRDLLRTVTQFIAADERVPDVARLPSDSYSVSSPDDGR